MSGPFRREEEEEEEEEGGSFALMHGATREATRATRSLAADARLIAPRAADSRKVTPTMMHWSDALRRKKATLFFSRRCAT